MGIGNPLERLPQVGDDEAHSENVAGIEEGCNGETKAFIAAVGYDDLIFGHAQSFAGFTS